MDIARRGLPDPAVRPEIYDDTPAKRAFAWLIDTGLIALATAVTIPLSLFTALFMLPIVWIAIGGAYRTVTLARGSATWGMRLMSIEIRDHGGERLDFGSALAHTALYYAAMGLLPLQILSGALMLGTPRRQGIGDHLLGTAAVNRSE